MQEGLNVGSLYQDGFKIVNISQQGVIVQEGTYNNTHIVKTFEYSLEIFLEEKGM
jgi:hypothetical protein